MTLRQVLEQLQNNTKDLDTHVMVWCLTDEGVWYLTEIEEITIGNVITIKPVNA